MSKNFLIGVTGSIAAYKSCELVSRLSQAGHKVRVVLTQHAGQFVSPLTFRTLSGHPVITDQFDEKNHAATQHIALARWADIVCVAPATANFITKYALGIADEILLTELLAFEGPVIIAPAMNHSMWKSYQVQNAVNTLSQHGVTIHPPASGQLACGEQGMGKLAEISELFELLVHHKVDTTNGPAPGGPVRSTESTPTTIEHSGRSDKILAGIHMLITAGPTRTYVDPVRYLTNRSSGKMGYALAKAARDLGATVHLISGPSEHTAQFPGCITVETTQQMYDAVERRLTDTDIFVGCAAVCDFETKNPVEQKIKKSHDDLVLSFNQSRDIIAEVAKHKARPPVVVGFAAETEDVNRNAVEKLRRKGLDFVVANDVSQPERIFGADNTQLTLINQRGQKQSLPRLSKYDASIRLFKWIHASYSNDRRIQPRYRSRSAQK